MTKEWTRPTNEGMIGGGSSNKWPDNDEMIGAGSGD